MKRGIMALEDNEETSTPEEQARVDAELATNVAENGAEAEGITNDADRIAEAQSIGEAVDTMTDTTEAAVESGEGLSEETAQTVEAAMEHFRTRLGYSKKVVPSLEGFKDKTTRLEQSKLALENLKALQAGLDKNLSIAQEGFFARVKNAFERWSTSDYEILKKIEAFKSAAAGEEKEIDDPAWGRVFANSGKTELTASDIATLLNHMLTQRKKAIPHIRKFNDLLRKAKNELDKSMFIAKDESVAEIDRIGEDFAGLKEEFQKDFQTSSKADNVKVKTANQSDIKKIADLVSKMVNDHEWNTTITNFVENAQEADFVNFKNGNTRLIRVVAADLRAYRRVIDDSARTIYSGISDISSATNKAYYGAYKYLQASIK